jgi:hypothetical protein
MFWLYCCYSAITSILFLFCIHFISGILHMEIPILIVLKIGENLIPCMWIHRIVHAKDVHNHLIENLCLVVCLGVKAVDFVSFMSNSDQRLHQNVLRKLISWSEIMVYVIPKWNHTRLKKRLVVSVIVIFFLPVVRMAIFENRSTTTNTQSFLFLVDGRPDM